VAVLDYLDFDLEVEATATPGSYLVSVLSSPRGEASGQMSFPFNPDALENVILKLGRTRSGVRAIGSPTQQLAKQFGSTLYDSLFTGEVGTCFRRSLDEADAHGKGLRVRLRLGKAPQLADVPWEYLYPSSLRQFLVLSTRTPVVRYLEQPRSVAPLQITTPMQVLVAVSSPTNLATLDVNAEVNRIRTALGELEQSGHVRVTVIGNASLAELRRALRRGTFHVLHFIGHGGFNPNTAEGMLAFEDENHLAHMVSGSDLATMIHDHSTLRLVLLNACEGARQSPADPLGGVAQSLVAQGIPAVVAMQFEITDQAATVFSSEFYAAIADGYPIDAALAEARVAVFSDDNDVEWGTPVLYLRASDGRIFDVANAAGPPPAHGGPAAATAGAAGAGARVVPVVVPPWPQPGAGGGAGAAALPADPGHLPPPGHGEAPSAPSGPGYGSVSTPSGPYDPGYGGGEPPSAPSDPGYGGGESPPPGPSDPLYGGGVPSEPGAVAPAKSGATWAVVVGAIAAVVALAVFLWPIVFPGGTPVSSQSAVPTSPFSVSPSVTVPTSPSPGRTTPRQTWPPVREVAPLKVFRGSVRIDGNTDDWQWQLVSRADQRIAGESTATGDIYLMWDDEALYLLAMVTDPSHDAPDPTQPSRVFRGDSVILELGPNNDGMDVEDLARPIDAYYMFGLPTNQIPVIAILGPNSQGTSFEAPRDSRTLDAAITITREGYVLEARIPWSTTRLNGVQGGAVFAANVQVSERRSNSFSNLGMMSTNPQRSAALRAHPAYWQDLELQP